MLGRAGLEELEKLETGWRLIDLSKRLVVRFLKYLKNDLVGLILLILALGSLVYGLSIERSARRLRQARAVLYQEARIQVDIGGAVKRPGVYYFTQGQRVWEAVQAAGGFDDRVDLYWVDSSFNQARPLIDGEKIYIPFKTKEGGSRLVSLNYASPNQLDSLPGVGLKTAQKVIQNRPYTKIEDLLYRQIVSQKVWNKIKHLISL